MDENRSAWGRVRRRHRLVDAVLAGSARTGRAAVSERAAAIAAEYGEEGVGGLLLDVHRRWQRTFDARLDAVLEQQPADLPAAVAEVARTTARLQPAALLLLDAYADHPALAAARERHRRMLVAATGVDPAHATGPPETSPTTPGACDERQRRCPAARLRPVRRRLRRGPLPAAGAPARLGSGA